MVSMLIQWALRVAAMIVEAAGKVSDVVKVAPNGGGMQRVDAGALRPFRLPRGASPVGEASRSSGSAAIAPSDGLDQSTTSPSRLYGGFPGPVLIVNAMSLLGRECLSRLVDSHWTVIAGVRSLPDGAALARTFGGCVHPALLELDDPESVELTLDEVGRTVGGAPFGVVLVCERSTLTPLERVFPSASPNSVGAQAALTRLLERADRLVLVSTKDAHDMPSGPLVGALRDVAARRIAAGEHEPHVTWVDSASSRHASRRITELVEVALQDGHEVRAGFSS